MGTVDDPAAGGGAGLGMVAGEIRASGFPEGVSGGTSENDGLADFEMNGVSSLLKMKENNNRRVTQAGSKVENLESLLGSMDVDDKGCDVEREVDAGSARDGGIGENDGMLDDGDGDGDGGSSLDLNSDELIDDVLEHPYSVGDFVWGKIKNHPWWPGQIYDPSDASDYAMKHRTSSNKILIAYFGDGTFAWCHPSQLKPFEENFEVFSKQGASKSFGNAVKAAVNEICRVVHSRMTCPCVTARSEDLAVGRKLAVNSGIKEGVIVPDCGIEKLAVCQLGSFELISNLRKMACAPFASRMLYFAVMRNWLVPFHKLKGVSQLPTYYEAVTIPGLEDRGDAVGDSMGNARIPFQGPVVEESLSPAQKESTLKKCAGTSGEDASSRRKEKSILEILGLNGEGVDHKTSTKKMEDEHAAERYDMSLKTADEDASGIASVEVKRRGRKKKVSGGAGNGGSEIKVGSEGHVTSEVKVDISETARASDGDQGNLDKGSYLRERKKSKYLSPPFTDVTKGRKKKDKEAEPLHAFGITQVAETIKSAADHLMGTHPIFEKKVDAKVFEIPDQGGDETSDQGLSDPPYEERHVTAKAEELKASTSDEMNEVRDAVLDPNRAMEAGTVSDDVEMFLPLYRSLVFRNGSNYKNFNKSKLGRQRKSPETELLGAQNNQSSDTRPHKEATKEVTPNPDAESPKTTATEEVVTPKPDSKPRKKKSDTKPQKKKETHEVSPKLAAKPRKKRATEAVTPNSKATYQSRLLGKATVKDDVGWLLVTFKQASSLPTKEDLITIYSKYGKLDENETVVHYNSKYALVLFEKISDAKEALKCSQAASPFGSSKTQFELLHANSTPYGTDAQKMGFARKQGRPKKAAAVVAPSTGCGDGSEVVQLMKRKLEKMSLLLDQSVGRELTNKVKSQMREEINGLLELVSPTRDASALS